MARTRATVHTAIWTDPEWRRLSVRAQHLYFLLLSQPTLSLAGVLDYLPQRWVGYAPDLDVSAIDELAAAKYVLIDHDTLEVCVRSFVRHDLGEKPNVNVVKGMWSAWAAVLSPVLRGVIVDNIPDHLWSEDAKATPPASAVALRAERASERASQRSSERAHEPIPTASTTATPAAGGSIARRSGTVGTARTGERGAWGGPVPPPLPDARDVVVGDVERPAPEVVAGITAPAKAALGRAS